MKYSETLSVLGRFALLIAVVAIAVPGRTAKIILFAVLLIAGALTALLLFRRDHKKSKPKAPPAHFTPEEVDRLLETCGTDDAPVPRLEKLLKTKTGTALPRHGKVVAEGRTIFDVTVCRSKNYQGIRYYRIAAGDDAFDEAYYIKDDPADRAVYFFSLNPETRASSAEPETETGPEDDSFRPWKEFDSLDDYIGNILARK